MKTYTFEYDLSLDMRPAKGTLTFGEDGVIRDADGNTPASGGIPASEIEEAGVVAGVGAGLLFVKMKDGNERILCRFTMSGLKPAGEFCKLVNYCSQTGGAHVPEKKERRTCPECGRPLVEGLSICVFCYDRAGLLKRAVTLMKPYLKRILTAQSLCALSDILFLMTPLFSRFLIDKYLSVGQGTLANILALCVGMFAARAFGELAFIISARRFNSAAVDYTNGLRSAAYDKVQRISMNTLSKRTPGDLIRRVMDDTSNITDFMSDGGRWMLDQVIIFLAVVVILLITNWRLTLICFLPVPIVMFALTRFWRMIRIRYERQWRKNSRSQSILHDIIKGIRTVKAFGNEEAEISKFAQVSKELAQVSSSNEQMWALLFPALIFCTGVGEFLVLYFGGKGVVVGSISMGVVVQFTMYISYVYGPLRWVVSFPRWLGDAMTSMVKVFEVLDDEVEIPEHEAPNNVPLAGEVSFDNVSFGYKSYEPVLKEVSLNIKPGEMVGIVGRSGVGKSTLINLLMRLYDPNAGSVRINGTDIRDMSPNYLHENIGVVFQDTFLFSGTIYDNIAYAKQGATPEEVVAACKIANAHDFIMQTLDGYNTIIGENGQSISGGERQRLAIARAVIKNPSILILDEATSSLDVETESAIQESLGRIVQGRTTLAIAHRLSTLRQADKLIVIDKGRIAEAGTHAELLKKKGIYYKLVMAQRQTTKMAG
ncbi:MAG: ABC transporter ATP-binding protein/permease [Defluviitaleaceae bacterium]|nr:ABC transporter ATP-binding protein/permease [Defluviitaleaceae bacterium]